MVVVGGVVGGGRGGVAVGVVEFRVVGAVAYASWLRHEAKAHREMEQRKRLEALINLSSQPPRASGLASERKAVS